MLKTQSSTLAFLAVLAATPVSANVITDWDATAVAVIQGNAPFPPPRLNSVDGAVRLAAMMHIAMFEAVNSIEQRYEPYTGAPKPVTGASQDAAAASAAAFVLAKLDPESAPKAKEALDKYLATYRTVMPRLARSNSAKRLPPGLSIGGPMMATRQRMRFVQSPSQASTPRRWLPSAGT